MIIIIIEIIMIKIIIIIIIIIIIKYQCRALPALVRITPTLLRNATARGAGFVISPDGLVVTNAHVAGLTTGIEVCVALYHT
jgi:S1-C subfamily serine protease